jgi:hypothetical protein
LHDLFGLIGTQGLTKKKHKKSKDERRKKKDRKKGEATI